MNFVVPHSLEGERIDRAVSVLTEYPRATVAQMIADGAVLLNGKAVAKPSIRVADEDVLDIEEPDLSVPLPKPDETIQFKVVWSDDDLAVIDKPEGLVVHPGAGNEDGTLVNGLLARFPILDERRPGEDSLRPGIVHRLDAGTSGLMIVALSDRAYEAMVDQMKNREVERRYLSLVWGHVEPEVGMIEAPIGRSDVDKTKMAISNRGREARTRYRVLAQRNVPKVSWVEAKLDTGRTHQIRVHFNALGHPVVGDRRYGGTRHGLDIHRPFLHAFRLRFTHPFTEEELSFVSALPDDLNAMLETLDLEGVEAPVVMNDEDADEVAPRVDES